MPTNFWAQIQGAAPASQYLKGNVTAVNGDGSYTVATSDGGVIRARPLPGQAWTTGQGVFVQDGRIVDVAPSLESVTQYV